jgi:glycosyltransferase involved in cell wall biosynthesis
MHAFPKIAVITPYYKEPTEMLRACHESVLSQGVAADHFMVADGHPNDAVATWPVQHVALNKGHADNGNTPRGMGGLLAQNQGYDFVTYLDADNWYHPGHLQAMLDCHAQTQADVCCSSRTYHHHNGTQLAVTEADEEAMLHVDTSCFFIHRRAFKLLGAWVHMPKPLSPIGDRVMLALMRHERYQLAFTKQRSVAFRSQYAAHYGQGTESPVIALKDFSEVQPSYTWLMTDDGVASCVSRMGFWPVPYLQNAQAASVQP